ncbi:hypothetical protein MMC11_005343 [Xylographa trunciseda]|nr:hypothetical protein [Xylographa trunciseda]
MKENCERFPRCISIQRMRQLGTEVFLFVLDLWTLVLTLSSKMEGQNRLQVAAGKNSKGTSQAAKRKRNQRRHKKSVKSVEKSGEETRKQKATEGQPVDGNQICPPDSPSHEEALEDHDRNSTIPKSITLLSKTKRKPSNRHNENAHSAKDSGKLVELLTQQTRANGGEPENSNNDQLSAPCEAKSWIKAKKLSKAHGTRKQGEHPVVQPLITGIADSIFWDTIETPRYEVHNTDPETEKPPKHKHKRNNRRLSAKQRTQHHVVGNTSANAPVVPVIQPTSVEPEQGQTRESSRSTDCTELTGAKKVRWDHNVGVESAERESSSFVPNQGSASLRGYSLEHQVKAKPLHHKPSHLTSLNHPNINHFFSTEVTTPIGVQSISKFELFRQATLSRRASLSNLQDLTGPLVRSPDTIFGRRQRSVTMPLCLDRSAGMAMNSPVEDNGNNSSRGISAAIHMLREKYGTRSTIALSPSTDRGSYSRRISGATNSPSCKPFLSSENTSNSAHETSNVTVSKPVFQSHLIESTSTALTTAHVIHDVTESQFPAIISAKNDSEHTMSGIPTSKEVMSAPLAENSNSRNKIMHSQARAEKPTYVPPHLRSLSKAEGTSDGMNTLDNKADSRNQDVITPHSTSSTACREQGQNGDASVAASLLTHVTSPTPKIRSSEEVFVARTPKPKTPRKLIRVEDLLPEHLRNVPKPILMGPQVKRNAEIAAKQIKFDPDTAIAQVVKRNKDYYQPVVELKATGQLVQELAAGEETPDDNAELAEDRSSMCSEDSKNMSTERIAVRRAARWRWFNGKVEPSETGHTEHTPKKELRHELAAWDGQWLTPPIEWNMRGQFNNNTRKHVQWMEDWVLARVMEALNKPVKLDVSDAGWLSGNTPASGTPKQWQTFPEDCIADHVPLEYGPVDWSQVPTLPPNDPYSHTVERRTQTSLLLAKKFCHDHYAEKKAAMKEKLARRVEHAQWKRQAEQSRLERAPKANIYIRPAQLSDVPQMAHLYNHYVLNTVHAPELDITAESEWQDRLRGAEDENLAFLVAVLKAAKKYGPGARGGRRGNRAGRGGFPRRSGFARQEEAQHDIASETIVGFSYAEDHAGMHSMYQHTVELQLFVDPNHYMKGIGKTLMDRMMTSLDKVYMAEAATDFVDDGKMCYDLGGAREVHKILVTVGFQFGEEKEFEWRKSWLEQKFEFDHIGTMNCLGKKFGKGVNIAQFLKETNTIHGSSIWYKEEPYRIPHREIAIRAREQEEARLAKEARE